MCFINGIWQKILMIKKYCDDYDHDYSISSIEVMN